jgi:signal transduction histidine kinase
VECKERRAHLSEFLQAGDFDKIQQHLSRLEQLKELPYDDGDPWRLVYQGPRASEQWGVEWVPYNNQARTNWRIKQGPGGPSLYHFPHLHDSKDCYLMSAREFGNAVTDVKVIYRIRTSRDINAIRDLSLLISGGSGTEAILPDLMGYTACTGRGNSSAGLQRETATMVSIPETLAPDTVYEITVERTGGRISRTIRDETGREISPPLVFIDSSALYNHMGFHTFSGEAEFFAIQIFERRSRFEIGQFIIPFDVEVGIDDKRVADHIFKLRLGRDSSYDQPLHLLIFEDITQSRRDHLALARSQKQLRSLSRHLESIREEERARIAREIHDVLGQVLTVMKLDLSWIRLKLEAGQAQIRDKVDMMAGNIDTAIRTVQRISGELRPGLLDDLGLEAAIEWQAGRFTEQTGIECAVSLPAESLVISREISTNLFRILQESLTNIARHAKAAKAWISLSKQSDMLFMTVRDNGIGLSAEKINNPLSLGLIGIKERVIYCGGQMEFNSEPGWGTEMIVRVPMEMAVND